VTERPHYRLFGTYRLLLATLVLVMHGAGVMLPDPSALRASSIGNAAVFSFFVLSGFVIAEALESFYRTDSGRFLANRLLRMMPAYWIAVAVTLALWLAIDHPDLARVTPANLLGNLVLFGTDLQISSFLVISIVWSLIIEMEFYICAALIYGLIKRTGWRGAWLALAAAIGLGGNVLVVQTDAYFRFFGPLFYAPFFVLGAGLYFLDRNSLPRLPTLVVTLIAGILALRGYAAYILRTQINLPVSLMVLLALFGLMLVLMRMRIPAANRWDGRLGDITYPTYLLHLGVGEFICATATGAVNQPFPTTAGGIAGILVMLAASLAAAVLLQMVVLRPLGAWRNRLRGTALYP
jgi:peptidoglycan/LPS O-acetylase OafA/YrhL